MIYFFLFQINIMLQSQFSTPSPTQEPNMCEIAYMNGPQLIITKSMHVIMIFLLIVQSIKHI